MKKIKKFTKQEIAILNIAFYVDELLNKVGMFPTIKNGENRIKMSVANQTRNGLLNKIKVIHR